MSEPAYPLHVSKRQTRWLTIAALIVVAVALIHNSLYVVGSTAINPGLSGLGVVSSSAASGGYLEVIRVGPKGAMGQAGVRAGDRIRYDDPVDFLRSEFRPGEVVGFTVKRGDLTSHLEVTAPPAVQGRFYPEGMVSPLLSSLLACAGGLIALRSRRTSGVVLGASLAAITLMGTYLTLWENTPALAPALYVLYTLVMTAGPAGLFAFAVMIRREASGRPVSRPWIAGVWGYAGLQGISIIQQVVYGLTQADLPLIGDGFLPMVLLQCLGFVLTFAVLALGVREAKGEDRTRFGFLLLALGLIFAGGNGLGMLINLTSNDFSFRNPLYVASQVLMLGGGATLLYAMLRHRVIDLGFAVNRTLVYGVLSTLLLVVFWFLEWGFEEIIPAETREANVLISAGIALGIFLVFHHVRDWVEKAVEHTFFRSWRDNEARLRRFLKDAGYITKDVNLAAASVTEFRRFACGAPTALYMVEDDGARRQAGELPGAPARLSADAPALVRLRADREPMDSGPTAELGAALVLPMVQRSEVIGFFALGSKPSQETYRPDEVAALAEAAQKIGFDLRALELDRLERQVQALTARLEPRGGPLADARA